MRKKFFILLIICILSIAYFGWLNTLGLRAEEPRRAVISYEMMLTGNYIAPHLMGWDYYNKPPLFNWVMVIFYWIFGGINEWIVRLPSTLSIFILAIINWQFVKKFLGSEIAILSSLFFLTSADILYYGSVNTGELDFFFTLLVYLNMMVIFTSMQNEKYLRLFALSWFLCALGFLTKGLPAIVFQVFTLLSVFIYNKNIRLLFSWSHLAGILMFLFPVGAYLYILHLRGDDLTFLFITFREASQRSAIGSQMMSILASILTSPFTILKLMLPWSLALFLLLFKGSKKIILSNPLLIFILLFSVVNMPIYFFSGELRGRYLYPFLPFICTLSATLIFSYYSNFIRIKKIIDILIISILIAFPILLLSAYFIPQLHLSPINKLIIGIIITFGIALSYFNLKNNSIRIYSMILLLGLSKIAMNITYLPESIEGSRASFCHDQVETMLEITNFSNIQFTGSPEVQNFSIKFGDKEYLSRTFESPMFISYQIPYYYALKTNQPLIYTQAPKKGNFYLLVDFDLPSHPGEILHQYIDPATRQKFYLIQYSGI